MNHTNRQTCGTHHPIFSHLFLSSLILLMLGLFSCPAAAQKTEQDKKPPGETKSQDLPSGKEIMARHIKMTGGQKAYDKIKNRVSVSTLELVGQGISIDIKTVAAKPNKIYILTDSKITGKIERGCNGKVYWENTLTTGPRIHTAVQREIGLRDSTFERFIYWDKIYETPKCTGKSKVADLECFVVVLTPRKTKGAEDLDAYQPITIHLDTENYLVRKLETVQNTEAGKIKVVAFPTEYKTIDGIKLAHKVTMEIVGQKRLITVKSTKHNVKLPEDQFALPDEVKKLLK